MIEAGETEQESMGSLPAWESELQLSGVWKSQALLLLAVAMTTSKLSAPLYARHCDVFLPTLFYVILPPILQHRYRTGVYGAKEIER